MNSLILCTAATLNIFSAPAGNTVVGEVPAYQRVYLMEGSLMRDWVFIGKPGENGVSPRGWVIYEGNRQDSLLARNVASQYWGKRVRLPA